MTSSPPAQPPAAGPVPLPTRASNRPPFAAAACPQALPGHGPPSWVAALPDRSSTAANVSDDANAASLASGTGQLPPKLAVYSSSEASTDPKTLIVGDSVVRHLTLPCAITYCLSGGKVTDLTGLIPALIDLHPTVDIVLAHMGANDVMTRNSTKLQDNLESLCYTVESLGKRCAMSGPIPTISSSSEQFSPLHHLHSWLKNFGSAAGYDFISNFSTFG